jgi:very-long-chain ceramide synthase
MLKYLEYQPACDTTFFLFLISWLYTRHYLYNRMLYSVCFENTRIFHRDNRDKPNYQAIPPKGGGQWKEGYNWDPQQGYYFTYEVHVAFIALLATLQLILILWFAMIIRLAVRVVRGSHAEDDRSDDEDDHDDTKEDSEIAPFPVMNGKVPSPSSSVAATNSTTSATGGIAFSNGIHQRKTVG